MSVVDLSKLPAPAVVETIDMDAIEQAMLADLAARDPNLSSLGPSDPAVKQIEVTAYREGLLRARVNDAAKRLLLAYATDEDLDNLAALFDVQRKQLVAADPAHNITAVFESDDDLRQRILLAPDSWSVAGSRNAYIFHAISASPQVASANATSPAPAQVLVSVLSTQGNGTADSDLLDVVSAALSQETVRPLTDQVTVQSADLVLFGVAAVLRLFPGPDATVVLDLASQRLADYLAASKIIGRSITLSGIYAALHVDGVAGVTLTSPLADVTVGDHEAAFCESIALNAQVLDD